MRDNSKIRMTLITPTPPDISAFGVRSLSAFLRMKGFDTRIVFLPGSIGLLKEEGGFVYSYSAEVLKDLVEICRGSELVGISFMTNYFDRAVQVTSELKSALDVPVIWGGVHPSCKPREALEYADMVCIGEGELSVLELMERLRDKKDYTDLKGIWFKDGDKIKRNGLRSFIKDLDSLPYFDFSNEGHYTYDRISQRIIPLTEEVLKQALPMLPYRGNKLKKAFRTMTDRGCPHKCTYCNVSNIKEMYREDQTSYFRARSVENAIEELVIIKKRFPFVEVIQFFDDTFFARPLKQIEYFATLYKQKVGLPFYCQASPTTLTEEKLSCLIDAGLAYVEMGIQTGSQRIKQMYGRQESNEKIIAAAKLLHKYRSRLMQPDYHIIIDNPWETEDDIYETAKLLYDIPKPYGLCISSLIFFPQTELYNRAVRDGILKDEKKEIYRKPFYLPPKRNFPNFIIYLFTFQRFPRWVLAFLLKERVVTYFEGKKLSSAFGLFYMAGETVRFLVKGFRVVARGDWRRIGMFVRELVVRDPVVGGRKS